MLMLQRCWCRTEWYTGFVSCDGALLLEPLTVQGWQANLCIEDVLVAAIYAMTDCEKGRVQPGSVEGPGGESGPLRIHFTTQNPSNVLQVRSPEAGPDWIPGPSGIPCPLLPLGGCNAIA